ncbi:MULTISPECIES: RNA-guided endonuclease InsQ/TnpB family protein [unclassified Tolypothrix]|uniref:RNA-guided endonuclease InsQ/TnpB family protein n=1 Tax=unclassified Tolypothrix TaxID=2649714 RepID=UPI0005EAC52A|nr:MULTISPECIES: RNA-guided endonuclease TnpB family protein [unclassified Tolypothrix]BAY92638.1 transposase [Microchaete diplosiphon NIES-3275]EKF05731.1 transposase [Tolypothrix sp. PCC 7601]MBE9083988.1 transposase [Tolypothrix sp. LEGE 11397]UYD26582.1 transposase [Tolypothrix sp. PCC 7712]UYD31180.1 transposase [Tolypothrix sp. PCC 7601]
MKARYQYRFYPTDQQRQSLRSLFGCVRVVWNDALAICKQSEKLPGYNKLSAMLTQSKKTDERKWLSDVSSVPLQQSLRHLDVAYKNFFNSLKSKRKGKKVGVPRFKKKTNSQSAEFTKAGFSIKDGMVYIAKIGTIKPIWSRELPSEPSSVTVIKDCANRYFLSFVVEVEPNITIAKNQSIGIDLGVKTFAVMSNGEKVLSPNYSKHDRKIRKLQRKLARQQKDSKRRNNTRIRIAKQHNQIADTRKDFLHKLSTKIVSENQTIFLEDLNVSGMVKNRRLSRVISLQGWREFRTLCEAKSEKFDRDFRVISRWEPTSQTCSCCGYRWGKIDLSVRSVLCLSCGTEQDRDENASRNIEKVGMGHRHDLKRTGSDCKTTSVASCCEPSRITDVLRR